MDQSEMNVTGILLAGGLSSRMGKEKGLVKVGNQYLYEYPLQVLEACCNEILISTCKDSVISRSYPIVCDETSGLGPIGGIYTCLKHSSNDLNVILSYDMPGVNEALVRYMLHEIKGDDMVVPSLKANQPEPLCGIYRKSILPVIEACIQQNEYAVHAVRNRSRSKVLLIKQHMSFWHPDLFANINKIGDLEQLSPGFGRITNEK